MTQKVASKTAKKVEILTKSDAALDVERRAFLINTTTVFGLFGLFAALTPFIRSLAPSAKTQAAGSLEVDISTIPEGEATTVLWRGKPVFIWHRNAKQIQLAQSQDNDPTLLDPQPDAERVQKPEWLVVMGVCTHLGCVPMQGGKYDGWRCPCHGSQFDNSGRLRVGPAATNLEVPPYAFLDDHTIRIG